MKELGTIEQEATDCRKAFEDVTVGAPVWCCHHEGLCELLREPAEKRIKYILSEKDIKEQARRLREFRPMKGVEAYADYHAKRAPLNADYHAKYTLLDTDYHAKRALLDTDYLAKRAPLDAEMQALHTAEYPDNTWDGNSIFGED